MSRAPRDDMLDGITRFLKRNLSPRSAQWPFVRGDYVVVDAEAPVVVCSATRDGWLRELAARAPTGLCMAAAVRNAVEGAELLHAMATNLSIQSLICVGEEASAQPVCSALSKLGREEDAPAGTVGSLMNSMAAHVDVAELAAVRKRVTFTSLPGRCDVEKIVAEVAKARSTSLRTDAGIVTREESSGVSRVIVPRGIRYETRSDKAGQFRIRLEEHSIVIDHLNGKGALLRVLEGKTARDLCLALIRNGWVSRLDHTAYLGRELARAEVALQNGQLFKQDSVEPSDGAPTEER
jgi:tetrahydromethanopterin S-methyltransferase subunit A